MKSVYFDHNSTTAVDDKVLQAMLPFFQDEFGNASSRHDYGTRARAAVNRAREQVANAVGAQASQVIFVSGGTEANNLFIKGAAATLKPTQIVVSAIEHPCVLKPALDLVKSGWKFRKLAVDKFGRVDLLDLDMALREPTGLVSVMSANNETGVIQEVISVAEKARKAKAWVHTDAVQAFGKAPVNFETLGVHGMTISAHKMYGPKGAAALVLDKRIEIKPILMGGGHEKGLRSGTENVPAIVGFGVAAELAMERRERLTQKLSAMRNHLERELHSLGAIIFGEGASRIPNTTYFSFPGVEGETLVIQLDKAGFAVASGSACSSTSTEPSATLLAMGVAPDIARGAIRVSFGKDNSMEEIDDFVRALKNIISDLKRLAAMAV